MHKTDFSIGTKPVLYTTPSWEWAVAWAKAEASKQPENGLSKPWIIVYDFDDTGLLELDFGLEVSGPRFDAWKKVCLSSNVLLTNTQSYMLLVCFSLLYFEERPPRWYRH